MLGYIVLFAVGLLFVVGLGLYRPLLISIKTQRSAI